MLRWRRSGDLTLAELAAKHGVHHTMIGAWKVKNDCNASDSRARKVRCRGGAGNGQGRAGVWLQAGPVFPD
jgi:hypothetical protein